MTTLGLCVIACTTLSGVTSGAASWLRDKGSWPASREEEESDAAVNTWVSSWKSLPSLWSATHPYAPCRTQLSGEILGRTLHMFGNESMLSRGYRCTVLAKSLQPQQTTRQRLQVLYPDKNVTLRWTTRASSVLHGSWNHEPSTVAWSRTPSSEPAMWEPSLTITPNSSFKAEEGRRMVDQVEADGSPRTAREWSRWQWLRRVK